MESTALNFGRVTLVGNFEAAKPRLPSEIASGMVRKRLCADIRVDGEETDYVYVEHPDDMWVFLVSSIDGTTVCQGRMCTVLGWLTEEGHLLKRKETA